MMTTTLSAIVSEEHDERERRAAPAPSGGVRRYTDRIPSKTTFADHVEPAVRSSFAVLQEERAHHRRGRQRDDHRHQDGRRESDGELAEQAADDAAHEQNGNEHRDERQADREDREADLLRALQRRRDGFMPASRWRVMFSITTIASSTTNPVEMVMAISDRLSRL